jgi:NAD-dependent dihydropyrimidine dehydrogenase PreA subunit
MTSWCNTVICNIVDYQMCMMEKDIEEAVMAIPAADEEHREVRLAIDAFEGGVRLKPKGDKNPYYCIKYCRACELACPVGK